MKEPTDKKEIFPEMNPVTFTISYQGLEVPVHTYRKQYFSLMSLITDKLQVQGFGLCSGMGSCGTCLVRIDSNRSKLTRFVLSCQVGINDELANLKIVVPDKR